MFDLPHILYTVISFAITAVLLILCALFIKDNKSKKRILKISALSTVILHYSSLYVDYFTTGSATVESVMLLPIYPCNVAMWFLVAVAFMNEEKKFFKYLAEATFYLGLTGGIIGIVLNENYMNTPSLADWDILKGLLSHSTMLFGCLYLLVGDYIKIRVSNLISVAGMLGFLLIDGIAIIWLYRLFNLTPPNSMFLLGTPFPNLSWLNTWTVGLMAVAVCFVATALYEQIALTKEERWYSKLKRYYKDQKYEKPLP